MITEIISISIGVLSLFFGLFTFVRATKNERFMRLHLAKLDGKIVRIKKTTEEASDSYSGIRNNLESKIASFSKEDISRLVQCGGESAKSAHLASIELLRDIRAIQHSLFGKVEHLESNGKLIIIAKLDEE